MLTIARANERAKQDFPAAVHVDGTARLQSVRRADNERFCRLIEGFERLTGVPVLLNTSFNDNDEPIVDSVADALRAFSRMDMDTLVIHNHVISRGSTSTNDY